MTEKVFAEGMAFILAAMPNLKPDKATLEIWRKLLEDFSDDEFKNSVVKFCRECTELYPGTNIIAKIREAAGRDRKNLGHPGPEEAWGIALAAADENKSVVWTDEIAEAQGVCREQLNAGDVVGARMAFIEKYRHLVAERNGQPPKWRATLGFDPGGREDAQEKAVRLNQEIKQRLEAGQSERKLLQ